MTCWACTCSPPASCTDGSALGSPPLSTTKECTVYIYKSNAGNSWLDAVQLQKLSRDLLLLGFFPHPKNPLGPSLPLILGFFPSSKEPTRPLSSLNTLKAAENMASNFKLHPQYAPPPNKDANPVSPPPQKKDAIPMPHTSPSGVRCPTPPLPGSDPPGAMMALKHTDL